MRFIGACLAAVFAAIAPASLAQTQASQVDEAAPAPPSAEQAPIALLVDATSGQVLHERNADRRFVPASITKTMTAYVAFELLEEGALDPRQTFAVRPETFREWSGKGSTMFLPADARPTVAELLMAIMNISANDGSIVLAEGAAGSVQQWTGMMNAKARELGMTNSHFHSPNGWMDEGKTFVSARDLARLARALILRHPQRYRTFIGNEGFSYNGIAQPNHDPLIGRVEGADGIKTGFTNEAGNGFLGSVERNGRRLIMVIAAADSARVRNDAARDYIEWGFGNFSHRTLFARGSTVGTARVQNGEARHVDLIPLTPISVSVPRGSDPEVSLRIRYEGPLKAPIAEGDRVAMLELEVEGMPTSQIPLVAAEEVAEAGTLDRFWNGIAGWFS